MMSMKDRIQARLQEELSPEMLEIIDESPNHQGGRTESHFRILAASSVFEGLTPLERQRKVFRALGGEIMSKIHALSQMTYTPKEWKSQSFVRKSPPCQSRQQSPLKKNL